MQNGDVEKKKNWKNNIYVEEGISLKEGETITVLGACDEKGENRVYGLLPLMTAAGADGEVHGFDESTDLDEAAAERHLVCWFGVHDETNVTGHVLKKDVTQQETTESFKEWARRRCRTTSSKKDGQSSTSSTTSTSWFSMTALVFFLLFPSLFGVNYSYQLISTHAHYEKIRHEISQTCLFLNFINGNYSF